MNQRRDSTLKRVKSDGTILHKSNASISGSGQSHNKLLSASQPDVQNGFQFPTLESDLLHENEISSACGSGVSHLRLNQTRHERSPRGTKPFSESRERHGGLGLSFRVNP